MKRWNRFSVAGDGDVFGALPAEWAGEPEDWDTEAGGPGGVLPEKWGARREKSAAASSGFSAGGKTAGAARLP